MAFVVQPQSVGINHAFYSQTIQEQLAIPLGGRLSLPFTATCFLLTLAAGVYLAHWTRFGRSVYAVGDDEASAALMGAQIGRTKVRVYVLSGLLAALAGVVYTFYTRAGDPACCVGFELDAIAAVVIGGTLLRGGVGFVAGTALGVLLLGLIQTLITFHGELSSWWTRVIIGALVLLFLALQNLLTRTR
jgi:simple sugar transport system permease protein